MIVAPQDRDDRYRSALRLEVSERSLDAALTFARVQTDSALGGDFAMNVGDAALRGEAVWFLHEHGGHDTQLVSVSKHQTGISVGYDLTPLLRLDVLWIHDWNGPSEALFPSLSWSARSDLDLTLGVQVFGGRDRAGDYGGQDPVFFFRGDLFF